MDTVLGRRKVPTALCAAVAVTASVLVSPAHGDTWRHHDPIKDVRVANYDDEIREFIDVGVAPWLKQADIGQVTVTHSSTNVRVATGIRKLPFFENSWSLRVVTSRGDTFDVQRRQIPDFWPDDVTIFVRRNGQDYTCEGITAFRTPAGMIADLPRACMNRPWKVRVSVQTRIVYPGRPEFGGYRRGLDDGLRIREVDEGASRLGPWVAAG